jgi:hypothetical protein
VQLLHEQIHTRVDEETWQAAWAEGRSLTIEQAIDLALRLGKGENL